MTQTIAQQIKWNFKANGYLEIRDKNGRIIYFEKPDGYWAKWEYDSQDRPLYYEDSDGDVVDYRPKPCEDAEDYQAKAYNENEAIEMLRDVDGETMERILRGIGMETQMLRQLILTAPMEQIEYLLEEKIGNQRHDTNK